MNYIVFDLEWNQSAEGKECSVEHMPFEIIEIGAVKLNRQMKQISEFHRLVRPKAYKEMHFKISEVTHMDMEELSRKGQPFPVVMEDFLNWCGEDEYIFCIWGSMDLTELQRNMTYHGMEIPFPRPLLYYDVQKLYSLEYSDGKSRISLDHAVEQLDLDQERPFHRALDDAVYTGRTLRHINMEEYGKYSRQRRCWATGSVCWKTSGSYGHGKEGTRCGAGRRSSCRSPLLPGLPGSYPWCCG